MEANRRKFLKVLGSGAAAASLTTVPLFSALADPPAGQNEFFVFIHASGGWDVMLWSDPRNEQRGLIEPPNSTVLDTTSLSRWVDAPMGTDGSATTYQLMRPAGSNITFGPAIGDLADLYDRLTVINGLAMNTVSHPDGIFFSATGRHLAGGRPVASSVDTMVANEFGTTTLFPSVSVLYPSAFIGTNLNRKAIPLRVGSVDTVAKSLTRSPLYDTPEDRDAVTVLLSQEARDLAARQYQPDVLLGTADQYDSLRQMLGSHLQDVFSGYRLQNAQPTFNYRGRYQGHNAVNAAFAIEAMKRNVVKCVSFALGGLDTHNANYRYHAANQQEIFNIIAQFVRLLDATDHPNLHGERLGAHTHILVISDFCRTPQINLSSGRDHYPNNSALVISPRFRGNMVYGRTDTDQLLPANAGMFADGMRPVSPPDLLTTFVSAFGIDPRKYLRDGEVVREILRT